MSNFENKPLNTTDEWESIVNSNSAQKSTARERVAARKRERRIRKLLMSAWAFGISAMSLVILGAAGAIAGWLTITAAIFCLAVGCFQFGRSLEARGK